MRFVAFRKRLNKVLERGENIEIIIGVAGAVLTALITIIKSWTHFLDLVSSNSIEIALKTRIEQHKYIMANSMFILGTICFLDFMWLFYKPSEWDWSFYKRMGSAALIIGIVAAIAEFIMWIYSILERVHVCRVCSVLIKDFIRKCGRVIADVFLRGYNKCKRALSKGISGKIIKCIQNIIYNVMKYLCDVWKQCDRSKKVSMKIDKRNIFRMTIFISSLFVGIALNCYSAWYERALQERITMSILTVVMSYTLFIWAAQERFSVGNVGLYYYDSDKNKKIYIYYKRDDYYCVCGDAEKEADREKTYLIPYKDLENIELTTVRKSDQE